MGNLGKRQIVLMIILGMVVTYALYDLLSPSDEPGKVPAPASKKSVPQVVDQSQVLHKQITALKESNGNPAGKKQKHLVERVNAGWKRDPFGMKVDRNTMAGYPPSVKGITERRPTGLNLTAISRKGNLAFVLINEEVLGPGESINGFQVDAIRDKSVVMSKNNFKFTLRLREEE